MHLPSVDHGKFLPLFELPHCDHPDKKTKAKVLKGREFVHVKHETSDFLWWKQRDSKQHCGMQFILHHGSNKEGGSSLDL